MGGALVGIGVSVVVLASRMGAADRALLKLVILVLVLPSEGVNAFVMFRVGSPYYVSLALIVITLVGLAIC